MTEEALTKNVSNNVKKDQQEQNLVETKAPAIFLFDVDGTLTLPRQKITDEMMQFMRELSKRVPIAVVGGSDLVKIFEQLPNENNELLKLFSFIFAENGLMGFEGLKELPKASMTKELGENRFQTLINFCLRYISNLELPFKRGTFIEHRNGMINVCPCGRSCTQEERMSFVEYENKFPIRQDFVQLLEQRFPIAENSLKFSIGGQISIDIFPTGWDKTYCLRYLKPKYEAIHFFGDKTLPGGNDYEIFTHPGTVGHNVNDPADCRKKVTETLAQLGL